MRHGSKLIIACAITLWTVHLAVIVSLGPTSRGAYLSDLIQLLLGLMLVGVIAKDTGRSRNVGRKYWSIAALSYGLLVFAQALAVYQDLVPSFSLPQWVALLFSFWTAALGMALLVDPESGSVPLDALTYLGFTQGILFLVAANFFFILPSAGQDGGDLALQLRTPYVSYNALIAVAFLIRGALGTSFGAKSFLRRMGFFMLASTAADVVYYYGPGRFLRTGEWFDLLWSGLLLMALISSETWHESGPEAPAVHPRAAARNQLFTELFALIFPVLIVIMCLRIAQQRFLVASIILLISLACSSARLLLTQKRLLITQEALQREATHDGLTSLWNHTAILETLDRELLRAHRENGSVGVMMIDIDKFKSVNDSHGHAAGDAVLKGLAHVFRDVLRSYDSLGRYGGEEFLVVAPGCDLSACFQLAERVRDRVAKHNIAIQDGSIAVTVSIGVAASGASVYSAEPLLQSADSALYKAKGEGRNRVESLTPGVKVV
jgi:diguanylate cyclase (GGDEF)-like protein